MSRKLQIKRGAVADLPTLAEGEFGWCTDSKELYIGNSDGNVKINSDVEASLEEHISDTANPHAVTKSQVGLGNVPNVATNNQTPTYTAASTLATLVSGEKLSVSMGKIMKAITDLISHIGNKSNPHAVTAAQVGLGNVNNTADNTKSVNHAATADSLTGLTATVTELNYTDGVTSNIQTQLNGKAASTHEHDYLPLSGGTLTGNLTGKYITGTWLQATSSANQNTAATKVATIDPSGWIYYRTPAQIISDAGVTATVAELNYVDGVTSNIQTQLNNKQASINGGASTIASSNLTASRALISDGNGKVAVSAVTSTELGYLDGVTSSVQTQLNAKAPLASPSFTGTPTAPTVATSTVGNQIATTQYVYNAIVEAENDEVFIAIHNETTKDELLSALDVDKSIICKFENTSTSKTVYMPLVRVENNALFYFYSAEYYVLYDGNNNTWFNVQETEFGGSKNISGVTVSSASWVDEIESTALWRYRISNSNITADMRVDVFFSVSDYTDDVASSYVRATNAGIVAPTTAGAGYVDIYSTDQPDSDLVCELTLTTLTEV